MTKKTSIQRALDYTSIVISTLILSYWMYYNGYVLFYGDSGGYIERAYSGQVSHHWAMFYSLFIKLFSFSWSLIGVAIMQSFIVSWLFWRFLKRLIPIEKYVPVALVAMSLFLNFATTLPWISNLIMSDIFTGIGVLALILLFLEKIKSTPFWIAFILYASGVIAHKSHKPILGVFMLVLTLVFFFYEWKIAKSAWKSYIPRLGIIWLGFVLSIVLMDPLINTFLSNEHVKKAQDTSLVKTANAEYHFVWRALQRVGVYEDALNEYCPERNYEYLCDRELMEKLGENGYWDDLYKGDQLSHEVVDLSKSALLDIDYVGPVISEGIMRGLKMSRNYRIPIRTKKIRSKRRKNKLFAQYKNDLKLYNNCLITQNRKMKGVRVSLSYLNTYILKYWLLILAFLVVGIRFTVWNQLTKKQVWDLIFIVAAMLGAYYINCLLMATFGNLGNPRYPTRVSWLVPAALVMTFLYWMTHLIRSRQSKDEVQVGEKE